MKKQNWTNVSMTELKILTYLARNPGQFASQLVHAGAVPRGTVYTTLNRLEEKRYVESVLVEASIKLNMDRRKYKLTTAGQRVIKDFAHEFGFTWTT
jgi:DNA-binding MarR family transcriptional regulator